MIVAGIDEAGYGPLLGPLVVGCSAWEIADDPAEPPTDELPCLWKRLRKLISKTRSKTGRKIHINDSKLVYAPAGGLKELERSVLAIAAARGDWPTQLEDLLAQVAPDVLGGPAGGGAVLTDYPWYAAFPGESFPCAQPALPIQLFANGLRAEMQRAGARCVHLAARIVLERQLNRLMDQTHNKASTLFSTAATHIDHLLRTFSQHGLTIFCDRQGGRAHYGALLRLMFDAWSLQITAETDGYSEYALTRHGHTVRLIFCEKAEAQCLPVALASMLSKYLRETLMQRFNAYWRQYLPDLAPTAGYHGDGTRFLDQINPKRRQLGIPDELLIRSR